jgi:hypothetical protein
MEALQSTSCHGLELAYLGACLLGPCVFASPPFPGARASSAICQLVVMACCLFLNAAELSDSGCPESEPCSLLPLLLSYFRQHPVTCLPFVYWCEFSSLPLLPSLLHFQQPLPPPLCSSFQFHCLFSFFSGGWSICPGLLCWFVPGVAEEYCVMLGSHLFGLPKVSQACLELATCSSGSVGVAAHMFSQCIMMWRRLPWARGSGCQSFNSDFNSWCFTSAKCSSSISARFTDSLSSHYLCLCTSHRFRSLHMLFLLLWLCNKVGNQFVIPPALLIFLKIALSLEVFWVSVWPLAFIFLFLWRISLAFWWELHWTYRLL